MDIFAEALQHVNMIVVDARATEQHMLRAANRSSEETNIIQYALLYVCRSQPERCVSGTEQRWANGWFT